MRVFQDPLHLTVPDPYEHEERWRTFGYVQQILIIVVHTEPEFNGDSLVRQGRIISARKATTHERKAFEENTHGC